MASGFMNMLSYWFFLASSVIMIASLFVETGPASGGWTVYPPLSALPQAMPGSGLGMTLWLVSMALFIVSSLLGGLNYIVTVGAAFDFHTGSIKNAPKFIQKMGMEWFYRLCSEPRRLFKRYFEVVPKFMVYAVGDLMRKK